MTKTIPIIMVQVDDPIAAGFVVSLARASGDVTALSAGIGEGFAGKWVELLKETVSSASRMAVLWDRQTTGPTSRESALKELRAATSALGVHLQSFEVRDPGALDATFAANCTRIAELAAQHRLPARFGDIRYVRDGEPHVLQDEYSRSIPCAGIYMSKILQGANPTELPVEQPTKCELVINLKTAQALGLTIPPSLLFQADEVIR
jgi:putative tryptophan/tyrosine transport system substrate-binding protein